MAMIEQMTPEEEARLRLAASISPSTPTEYMLRHIPLWVKMSILRRNLGVGGVFNPISLFKGGEQGAWYDPSDLRTLFQDAEGTIPVTADGDPVGLMRDKSGNGNHATQEISASRPLYRTDGVLHWLQFDGVDDHLVTPITSYRAQLTAFFVASLRVGVTREGPVLNSAGTVSSYNGLRHSLRLGGNQGGRFTYYAGSATGSGFVASMADESAYESSVRGITWDGSLDAGAVKTYSGASLIRTQTATRDITVDLQTTGPLTIGKTTIGTDYFLDGTISSIVVRESAIYGNEVMLAGYLTKLAGITL